MADSSMKCLDFAIFFVFLARFLLSRPLNCSSSNIILSICLPCCLASRSLAVPGAQSSGRGGAPNPKDITLEGDVEGCGCSVRPREARSRTHIEATPLMDCMFSMTIECTCIMSSSSSALRKKEPHGQRAHQGGQCTVRESNAQVDAKQHLHGFPGHSHLPCVCFCEVSGQRLDLLEDGVDAADDACRIHDW